MSTTVEQIKSRLNIVDVVSSYIRVEKRGGSFKALCPFHNEKTPSMSISPERGSFHCFGCGKGGDIFTFVQEMEGLDFIGSLRVLAERAGVEIVWDGKRENRDEKERLYEILQEAADFFHGTLAKNRDALLYLKNRGLLAKTAEDFYLGFAADSWDDLCKHLTAKKYSGEEIEKAGLVLRSKEGRRGWYDRFRSRIMFPLSDSAGRVVGFSGRISEKEASGEAGAKYINTPETLLYGKSKILYGLHKAKQAIREKGFVVAVEGQMDLLMSHQAGAANTVAVSGTAFSDEHVRTLKRFAERIVFAFDSDAAGMSATKRASIMALGLGMDVRAASFPDGKDPADMIRESPDAWRATVEDAEHVISFFLKILREKEKDVRIFRLGVQKEVLPLVAAMRSAIDREHFIEAVAKEIGLSEDAIKEDLQRIDSPARVQNATSSFLLQGADKKSSRKDAIVRELVGIYLWQEKEEKHKRVVEGMGVEFSEEEKRVLVFSAEEMYRNKKDLGKLIAELEAELEAEALKEERERITNALMGDESASGNADKLGARHLEISQRLEQLKNKIHGEKK